jgi:hypothetical protein
MFGSGGPPGRRTNERRERREIAHFVRNDGFCCGRLESQEGSLADSLGFTGWSLCYERPQGSQKALALRYRGLEAEEFAGSHDQGQGEEGDGDFADEAYGEGAEALFAHFAKVGAEADTSEGEQEGPAGEIGE